MRGKAGLACGLGRVRFWKPTGLPFISEPIRFANSYGLGYVRHPIAAIHYRPRPGQRRKSQHKAAFGSDGGRRLSSGIFAARLFYADFTLGWFSTLHSRGIM